MDEQRLSPIQPEAVRSGGDYAGVVLRDCCWTGTGLEGISLEDSLLSKVRAPDLRLPNLRWNNVAARDCDFANAIWEKARLAAGVLKKCRLTGWNVSGGTLRNVRFEGCRIDIAVLHGVTLRDCAFNECDLRESDFQGARLRNVEFRNCDLRNARFPAASLTAVDFRGSHLAGVHLPVESLAGNIFDPSQLFDVARLLRIIV